MEEGTIRATQTCRGLSVIGVSLDKDWKGANPYLEEKKVNVDTVVIGNWDLANRFGVVNALPGLCLLIAAAK
jgi:hypothetical protein